MPAGNTATNDPNHDYPRFCDPCETRIRHSMAQGSARTDEGGAAPGPLHSVPCRGETVPPAVNSGGSAAMVNSGGSSSTVESRETAQARERRGGRGGREEGRGGVRLVKSGSSAPSNWTEIEGASFTFRVIQLTSRPLASRADCRVSRTDRLGPSRPVQASTTPVAEARAETVTVSLCHT